MRCPEPLGLAEKLAMLKHLAIGQSPISLSLTRLTKKQTRLAVVQKRLAGFQKHLGTVQ